MRTKSASKMGVANCSIPRRPASKKDLDLGNPLDQLQEAYSKFHLHCRVCKTPYELSDLKANIDAWFHPAGEEYTPAIYCFSACSCAKCGASTCAGCGLKPNKSSPAAIRSLEADNEDTVHNCCDQGRLFGLWVVLCCFDEHELEPKAKPEAPKALKATKISFTNPKKPKNYKHAIGKGVGYDDGPEWDAAGGHYLVTNKAAVDSADASAIAKAIGDCDASDNYLMDILDLVTQILDQPVTFSTSPNTQDTLLFFRTSLLMDRVCALIRNDSISDLTERFNLYSEIFALIESFVIEELYQLLFEQQLDRTNSPGLRALSNGTYEGQPFVNLSADQPSLFACSRNTYKQATVFLNISKNIKRGKTKTPSDDLVANMCETIVQVYGDLESKMATEESERDSSEEAKDEWTKFWEQNQVTFTDDVLKNHRFTKSFPNLRSGSKGRMIAISKEISNMTTSLPAGVFLKVAESRADVMKVLIIGVDGSPYAGGIFIFDVLLPHNYPNSPPKMAFVLEGVDSEAPAMNPNLHPGGSVCLSILNTWSGHQSQMWQPGRSTVLAVLVSVQAMILGAPLPLHNEPGLGMLGESPEVIQHKRFVQVKTLKYAMIAWLLKIQPSAEKEPDVWDDIVDKYWKYNGKAVLRIVEQWALDNRIIKAYNKMKLPSIPWEDGIEYGPAPPKHGKLVTEDLAQKLEGLISSRLDEGEAPTDGTSSKSSEGQILNSSDGTSNDDRSISGKTSISTSSGTELAGAKKNSGNKGKRKESENDSESSKEPNKKGSKRRKTKNEEEDAYESDSDHARNDILPKSKTKNELAAGSKKGRWVYTGGRSLKEVRNACHAFDLTPARSIFDSIDRLEDYVNDEGKAGDDLALEYGEVKKPLK